MEWSAVLQKISAITGLNGTEISKKIKVSRAMVSLLMRGEREPSLHTQMEIRKLISTDENLLRHFEGFEEEIIGATKPREKGAQGHDEELIALRIRAEVAEKLNEQLMKINDRLIKVCGEGPPAEEVKRHRKSA